MLKAGLLLLVAGLLVNRTYSQEPSLKESPQVLLASESTVGQLVPELIITDLHGQQRKLSAYSSERYLVIAFTSTSCPLCRKYAPTLARLEKQYANRSVAFLFINPTATDNTEEIRKHPFAGVYCHDIKGEVTAALGIRSTTEVVVIDAARTVVYRGAVDDQYGLGYSLDAPKQHFLKQALDELLSGRQPLIQATSAPGCILDAPSKQPVKQPITYYGRISRIVQMHCLECHRTGGVAPFTLDSYEALIAHKGMIGKVVEKGTMPPWFAASPPAGQHSRWINDRSIPTQDKADLLNWLKGTHEIGNPQDAPLPRVFDEHWQIGKPDAVLKFEKPVSIKAEGTMPYQNIRVESSFEEDKWVQAVEVRPSARGVVHHVIVSVIPSGTVLDRIRNRGSGDAVARLREGGDERSGFFAIYVPGNGQLVFPPGFAKKLPKGAKLNFQMHYTPNGTATTDQTEIGFVFAREKPQFEVKVAGIANLRFEIPPQAANYEVTQRLRIPFDATIMGFVPHMHLRGKACRYEVVSPDERKQVILDIPRYDFNWQLLYRLKEPLALKQGDVLLYTSWYDNSDKNRANPDPSKTVRWGPQTYDEMMLGYVEYFIPAKP